MVVRPTGGDEDPPLIGGALCLDFANTVDARFPRPGEHPPEYLPTYERLVRWSVRAGALDAAAARVLLPHARRHPGAARTALGDARALREAIHAVFAAALAGAPPPPDAARAVRRRAAQALEQGALAGAPPYAVRWSAPALRAMLWPIALSALELATSADLARLKQCPGQDGRCGWLFLDTTKNGGRRWCSMRVCGNPAKARRQGERRRAQRAARAARPR